MPIQAHRRTTLALTMISGAIALALLGGCMKQMFTNSPGGNMRSDDSFTYISTPFEPLTVTLYDHRDNEPLWTVDVPVGQKVTLRFLENKAMQGTTRRPDIMQWAIYDKDKRRADLTNKMAVPSADARMLKVAIRDNIEFPAEDPEPIEFNDPNRDWVPVEPRRFRGVPLDSNARQGSYISDD
ncbi:MAG: hypothetical protein JJ916_00365 [Phycisphaerales bacterium]|nr:hypothetical protein [Phycisphaerales bacterium]